MYYIDVSREVFDEFAKKLDPIFKGEVKDWKECHPDYLYKTPFYSDDTNVTDEAQKYLMGSVDDFNYVKRKLAEFKRKPVQVNIV